MDCDYCGKKIVGKYHQNEEFVSGKYCSHDCLMAAVFAKEQECTNWDGITYLSDEI